MRHASLPGEYCGVCGENLKPGERYFRAPATDSATHESCPTMPNPAFTARVHKRGYRVYTWGVERSAR